MKKIRWAILPLMLLVLCSVIPFGALAASSEISGTAIVFVPADSAVIRFELCSYARTQEKAEEEGRIALEALQKKLADYGTVVEEGFYTRESISGIRLCAVRCLSITTDQVGECDRLCALLHECGVSAICEAVYLCRDSTAGEGEALRLAVENAVARAQLLGYTAEPTHVTDHGSFAVYSAVSGGVPCVRVECHVTACFE